MLSFALFVWFTMKYVWPPLTKAMAERQTRIADGIAAGERGKHELELAQVRATEVIRQAHADAADVIAQASRRAAEMIEEARDDARAEGERLIASAKIEIEQLVNQARTELRAQASAATIAAAARVLEREIDAKTHEKLIADLVKQI